MTPHQRWTQTDITQLRARLAEGDRVEQVAEALGRSVADVEAIMSRLRMRARPA
jgi:hypothetical protein